MIERPASIINHPTSAIKRNARSRISFFEWAVALSGGLTLAFTAWGFAGVIAWSLHALLIGGLLTLLLALWPRSGSRKVVSSHQNSELDVGRSTFDVPSSPLRRLLRFPPFWLSLAFLLYLLIGALNPAVAVVGDERGWWVEAIQVPLATWLPISVRSDYEPMNAFRVLESFTAAFALMWGLWAGITRRKAALCVLWCLLLSGAGMGLVAILQHLSDADKVLWTLKSANPLFWGSFFYRNQGAAYLNLILVAAGFLYFYHAKRTHERAQSGGPHFLCFLLFAFVAASVGLALSRGGILFGSVIAIAFLLGALLQYLLSAHRLGSSLGISLLAGLLLTGGAAFMIHQVDLRAIQERFGDVEATIENAESDTRALSSRATWDMAQDRLCFGWGAGSFRYIFPMYQRNYPQIFYGRYYKKNGWVGRKVFHYAHNDIVQFLAEYGIVGCGLLVLTFAGLLAYSLPAIRYQSLAISYLLVGIACATAHAFFDFIFNSPAYWVAFVGLITISCKLLMLEGRRRISSGLKKFRGSEV